MWEAVTALATLATGIAIVLTVLLGVRQLTGAHLSHLRRATQLEGAMKIFDDLFTPTFLEASRFVVHELKDRMLDSEFRAEVSLMQHADDQLRKGLLVIRYYERVGTYVKNGLIDGAIIYDLMLSHVVQTWEALGEVVKIHRAAHGEGYCENFEFLYTDGMRWLTRSHATDFLKHIPSGDVPASA